MATWKTAAAVIDLRKDKKKRQKRSGSRNCGCGYQRQILDSKMPDDDIIEGYMELEHDMDNRHFNATVTEQCLENVIRKHLEDQLYNEAQVPDWIDGIIRDIGAELKQMDLSPRYKRIINVSILHWNENTNIHTDCLCFWDDESDYSTSYTFRNGSIACSAIVFAVHID